MTTATNNQGTTNTNGSTNGKPKAVMTPVDAIGKISKILDQLSAVDRKRVLAFVSETSE
jgi:hypothetical protein